MTRARLPLELTEPAHALLLLLLAPPPPSTVWLHTHMGKSLLCTLPNVWRGMFLNIVKPAAAQYNYTEERLPWDSVGCM
jgi:hypothetical protein